MQSLFLEATKETPQFNFNIDESRFFIKGTSKLSSNTDFYERITLFLNTIEQAKPMRLNLDLSFDEICNKSKRGLVFFLMRLKELQINCKTDININWYYNEGNTLIERIGDDLEYMVKMSVKTIAVKADVKTTEQIAEFA